MSIKKTTNAGKGVEKRNSHSVLAGTQAGAAIMEISMEVSHKTKNSANIWPNYSTPRYIVEGLQANTQ